MSSLAKATSVVLILNMLSKVLGFVRDATLAAYFGTSGITDAYLVAYTFPYSLQAVFGMSFLLVMVPLLTKYMAEGRKKEAYGIARDVSLRLVLILGGIVIVGEVLAFPLTRMLAPGFTAENLALSVKLTRIILPSIVFMGMAMLFSGILNGEKRFALASFGPALANLVVIGSIVLTARKLGIQGVAYGTLMGFFAFFLMLWVGVQKKGFRLFSHANSNKPEALRVLRDILPVTLSVSVNQFFLMIARGFGSSLIPGTISALEFAGRIINLPIGVFTAAVVTASYPMLAETALKGDRQALSENLLGTIRLILLVMVPAAVGLVVLREPLIGLLYQRGAFDQAAVTLTSEVLVYYAWGMIAMSVNLVLTRAYFAVSNYRGPLIAGIVALVIHIAISAALVDTFNHKGLAAAYAMANVAYAIFLMIGYRKYMLSDNLKAQGRVVIKFILAAAVMGWSVLSVKGFLLNMLQPGTLGTLILLLICGALGAIVYFLFLAVLGYDEHLKYFRKRRNEGANL
ncbi:murein biosynthesis integral membrane protein MurJ [Clostridia bacterium]|nr:murein biosynthesis integral membrane protein MurJ [Clostridia bacterium]